MRRVLILGGTGWLGREIAREAVADGAEVTCLARGESGEVPEGVTLVKADRRASGAYDTLSGDWDEVIELSHAPNLVESALQALASRAAHWTLVSTVSVYASNDEIGADESAALVEPRDPTQYADAKVIAERMTSALVGDRLLIARSGLIVGPGDPSDRFSYWPLRLEAGGFVLAPVRDGRFVQVIDVGDLARWIVRAGRDKLVRAVNAVGKVHSMAGFFDVARIITGFNDLADGADDDEFPENVLEEIDDDELLAHCVNYWAGPRSLPLWLPLSEVGFATRHGSAFLASGGTLRPLGETIERVLDDPNRTPLDGARRAGLTPHDEGEILHDIARDSILGLTSEG